MLPTKRNASVRVAELEAKIGRCNYSHDLPQLIVNENNLVPDDLVHGTE
jgi:hypothetical protein